MAKQIRLKGPKAKIIGAQIPNDLSIAIDVWIEQHPDPKPSRSDVLREALCRLILPEPRSIEAPPEDVRWERGESSPRWR